MHGIEPFYNWRHLYIASEDNQSPFYNKEYSEFEYTNTIYNFYIHPQWDDIGSETIYIKILFVDYEESYAIIELIGEWNDAINNDIMFLKRDIVDELNNYGGELDEINWRTFSPGKLFGNVSKIINKRLS